MFCNKCGKELEKGTKFCSGCGSKVEAKAETKVEPKKEVKKEVGGESNGLAIAGMVIGIVSLILAWFLTLFILVVPVVGLILSIVAKGKKGFKITGIITNALAIVVAIFVFIFSMFLLGSAIDDIYDSNKDEINRIKDKIEDDIKDVQKTTKSSSPVGEWTCVNYYDSNISDYVGNVKSAPSDKKTVLNLKSNGSFQYGPYVDSYKNYFKGTYTYKTEPEKASTESSMNVKFFDIEGNITDAVADGAALNDKTNMHLEMELLGQSDFDAALILFYSSYNTYYCER